MNIFKRILAVFLLTLTVAVVGYLVYTGSRLTALSGQEERTKTEASYEQAENL